MNKNCIGCEVPKVEDGNTYFCKTLGRNLYCKYDREKGISCLERTHEYARRNGISICTKFSYRKLFAGCVGFFAGIVAAPILLVAAPFFFAWFLYNEEEY